VVVHVDATVLADPDAPGQSVLEDGAHVSAETSQRPACDASRMAMRHDPNGSARTAKGVVVPSRMMSLPAPAPAHLRKSLRGFVQKLAGCRE
jgi:hypothetical protein